MEWLRATALKLIVVALKLHFVYDEVTVRVNTDWNCYRNIRRQATFKELKCCPYF